MRTSRRRRVRQRRTRDNRFCFCLFVFFCLFLFVCFLDLHITEANREEEKQNLYTCTIQTCEGISMYKYNKIGKYIDPQTPRKYDVVTDLGHLNSNI
jgi:hypothetical protein